MSYLTPHPRPFSEKGTYSFYEVDSKELYNNNVIKYGNEWKEYWENKNPITYKINSLGYRMNEIEEINQNNYIVTLGCSHTAGLGLPLEETWTYKLSKHLGTDLVNGSAPGSSNDLILMNLIRLLSSLKKPRLVVIAWTSIYRKLFWDGDKLTFHTPVSYLSREGIIVKDENKWFNKPVKWEKSYDDYLINERELYSQFNELKNQVVSLCKISNVPLLMVTLFREYESYQDILKIPISHNLNDIYNCARDIDHYGIGTQNMILRTIIKNYKHD